MLLAHYVNPLPGNSPIKIGTTSRCIYCGRPDEPRGIEHAIPEAIGGGLLLMNATCPCGPKLTHGFEGTVTREIFQQVRRQSGIKGKKRKRGADAFLLTVHEKFAEPFDVAPARKVSIDDHPSMLFIPRLQPLKRLGTQQLLQVMEGKPVPFDLWQLVPDIDQRVKRLKETGSSGSWMLQTVQIDPLLRLLAKIAHTAAIACLGYEGFEHFLVELISGDMSRAAELVGELPAEAPSLFPFGYRQGLHEVAVGLHYEEGNCFVLAHIRLFSNLFRGQSPFFTPAYAVIAGTPSQAPRTIAAAKGN
jgi:hypothetical protein